MFTLEFITTSTGFQKSGDSFTLYRLFYRDKAGRSMFLNLYDNSPVLLGDVSCNMSEAFDSLSHGTTFIVYNGPNGAVIPAFTC